MRTTLFTAMVAMCLVASHCTANVPQHDQTGTATTTTTAPTDPNAPAADHTPPNPVDGHTPSGGGDVSTDGLLNAAGRDANTSPVHGVTLTGDGSTGSPNGGSGLDSTRVGSGTTGISNTGGTVTNTGASSTSSSSSSSSTSSSTTQTSTGTHTGTGRASSPTHTSNNTHTGTVASPNKGDNGTPSGKPDLAIGTGSAIYTTTTTQMVEDVEPKQNTNETSTAPVIPLQKPTKTVQQQNSVEKKNDGSSSTILALAYAALLTVAVMIVAPV